MPSAESRPARLLGRLALIGCAALALLTYPLTPSAGVRGDGAVPHGPVATRPAPATTESPVPAPVRPVGLSIPAIGVEESVVVPLDLLPSGQLAAPADFARVGWYAGGGVPGDQGVAVLAGHVDSRSGPAVFFRLRELRPGDTITVRRSDSAAAIFTVDDVRRYPKSDFPAEDVYAATPGNSLRVITCGGSFDAARRSYRDNIVVFASMHWAGW